MEDAATAEISRSQIWQWLHHGRVQRRRRRAASPTRRSAALGPGYEDARELFEQHRDPARLRRVPDAAGVRPARVTIDEARALWSPGGPYLNTATYGLPPEPAWDAMQQALTDWRHGRTSWEAWNDETHRARELFARLVAFPPSASPSVQRSPSWSGLLAASLPRGRVLAPEGDFTSLLWPWLANGHEVDTVPLSRLADAIDTSTSVIALSAVQSSTGELADLDAIEAAAGEQEPSSCSTRRRHADGFTSTRRASTRSPAPATSGSARPRGPPTCTLSERLLDRVVPAHAGWFAGEDRYASFYGTPIRLASSARRLRHVPGLVLVGGRRADARALPRAWRPGRSSGTMLRLRTGSATGLGAPTGQLCDRQGGRSGRFHSARARGDPCSDESRLAAGVLPRLHDRGRRRRCTRGSRRVRMRRDETRSDRWFERDRPRRRAQGCGGGLGCDRRVSKSGPGRDRRPSGRARRHGRHGGPSVLRLGGTIDHLVSSTVARAGGPAKELDLDAARRAFETKLLGSAGRGPGRRCARLDRSPLRCRQLRRRCGAAARPPRSTVRSRHSSGPWRSSSPRCG